MGKKYLSISEDENGNPLFVEREKRHFFSIKRNPYLFPKSPKPLRRPFSYSSYYPVSYWHKAIFRNESDKGYLALAGSKGKCVDTFMPYLKKDILGFLKCCSLNKGNATILLILDDNDRGEGTFQTKLVKSLGEMVPEGDMVEMPRDGRFLLSRFYNIVLKCRDMLSTKVSDLDDAITNMRRNLYKNPKINIPFWFHYWCLTSYKSPNVAALILSHQDTETALPPQDILFLTEYERLCNSFLMGQDVLIVDLLREPDGERSHKDILRAMEMFYPHDRIAHISLFNTPLSRQEIEQHQRI